MGGRPQGSPLRMRYKGCGGRRDTWVPPYIIFVLYGRARVPCRGCGKNPVGPMWASAPTEAQQEVQWAGDRKGRPYGCVTRGAVRRDDVGIGPYGWILWGYPYTISPKRAQVLLSVIFMSRYWPRADLSPTRCTRRPPAVRPERGQRASSVSPSTRQRRVLPT